MDIFGNKELDTKLIKDQQKSVLIVEPYYGGSHKQWCDGLKRQLGERGIYTVIHSQPARHWKWRMESGAYFLAERYLSEGQHYDCIIGTDMLNLSLYKALISKTSTQVPKFVYYFHENQISYPWRGEGQSEKNLHYGFINLMSALVADTVVFNSNYHKDIFFKALDKYLNIFPDRIPKEQIKHLEKDAKVVPIGLDLPNVSFDKSKYLKPILLWNHRREHDKNPELFFETLLDLAGEGLDFDLIVLGKKYSRQPKIFDAAIPQLGKKVLYNGYTDTREEYQKLLGRANILPVTNAHDFFGISTVEALHYGCLPLLPLDLAYPEHIDPSEHPEVFYNTKEEFKIKLRTLIERFPLQSPQYFAMQKYDWRTVIGQYVHILV